MNLKARSFKVYSSDNARYVRDLVARCMADEEMTTQRDGEQMFWLAVLSDEELKYLEERKK